MFDSWTCCIQLSWITSNPITHFLQLQTNNSNSCKPGRRVDVVIKSQLSAESRASPTVVYPAMSRKGHRKKFEVERTATTRLCPNCQLQLQRKGTNCPFAATQSISFQWRWKKLLFLVSAPKGTRWLLQLYFRLTNEKGKHDKIYTERRGGEWKHIIAKYVNFYWNAQHTQYKPI